ncbi:MAG: hypothetical protein QNJ36_19835 [Calothrix sp. MO_167.B42]|nr:hypothetical protein [Calothrix sp. MO_167.B42]
MPVATFTNDWISRAANILFRGGAPPNQAQFYLCAANTAALSRASNLADFISNELAVENGYSRIAIDFGNGAGTYDTNDQRHELPNATGAFTASGGALQFQTIFILADANPIASLNFSPTNVDATTDTITINNHGLVNGDNVIFTPDSLAVLPGGINQGTIYTTTNTTTNTFQLTGVDITNTGSGNFKTRTANGSTVLFGVENTAITVPDGQSYSYSIPVVTLNTGYVQGV